MQDVENKYNIEVATRIVTLYGELRNSNKVKSQKDFCQKFGFSPGFFTEIKKGRSGATPDALQNITAEFEEYKDWLITGRNPPFVSEEFKIHGDSVNNINKTEDGQYVIPEALWLDYLERVRSQNECRLCESKDRLIESLEKHIALLQGEISNLKKGDVLLGKNVKCADAG